MVSRSLPGWHAGERPPEVLVAPPASRWQYHGANHPEDLRQGR
jgi:hypothetical protein